VGDDQYFADVGIAFGFPCPQIIFHDQVDGFDQSLPAIRILAAKPLIDHQQLQPRPGPFGQGMRERQSDGKIDAERFSAGKEFIFPRTSRITDQNIQGLDGAILFFILPLAQRGKT
jgi:hypothetical protein